VVGVNAASVSVVIPVRDGSRFVGQAVASAAAQSLHALEILVVDDGSRDGSADVARSSGATVIVQRPAGAGAARNRGADIAAGSLIAFLDADDLMHPERLCRQVELLKADPGAAGVLGLVGQTTVDGPTPDWDDPATPLVTGLIPSTLTVRAQVFAASGGFATDLVAGEFVDWMARCRAAGLRFTVQDELVGLRRAHTANLTRDGSRVARGYLEVARRAVDRSRR
jgi:glycosyltransferase involved in cell wall biosynthesis